jgi:hypothetical protein
MSEAPGARQACHVAERRMGYSTRRHMLGPACPEALLPDRELYLPSFSHFLIVNKSSLAQRQRHVPQGATSQRLLLAC